MKIINRLKGYCDGATAYGSDECRIFPREPAARKLNVAHVGSEIF